MTGRISWLGQLGPCSTWLWSPGRLVAWSAGSSAITPPVLVLRSKRGKLLLETSSRIRCPGRKTFDVTDRSRLSWQGSPGVSGSGSASDLRLWVPKTYATWADALGIAVGSVKRLGVGRAGLGSAGGGMIFGLWA
jgi:hypothetical protein